MTSIVPYFGRFNYVSVELLTHTYTPIISPSSVSYTDKQHIYVIQRQLNIITNIYILIIKELY